MEFDKHELGIIRVAICRELIRLDRETKRLRKKAVHKPGELSSHAMECGAAQQLWNKIKDAK
jgi:hypothetical protein